MEQRMYHKLIPAGVFTKGLNKKQKQKTKQNKKKPRLSTCPKANIYKQREYKAGFVNFYKKGTKSCKISKWEQSFPA